MRYLLSLFVLLFVVGCTAVEVTRLDSAPANRANVSPGDVKLYQSVESVECDFTRIAIITAEHSAATKTQKAFEMAKSKAASQGANVLVAQPDRSESVMAQTTTEFLGLYEEHPCE